MSHSNIFSTLGYAEGEVLQDNQRNLVVRLERDGQQFVGKLARDAEQSHIENEAWWGLMMDRLATEAASVCAPKMVAYGHGWLVTEFIDAPQLSERDSSSEWYIGKHMTAVVNVLAWLDKVPVPERSEPKDPTETAPAAKLLTKADEWITEPLKQGMVTEVEYRLAADKIRQSQGDIRPALQHGDVVAEHMFMVDDRICLFDGEHASLAKPRHYDMAYLYTRLATRGHAPELAETLLHEYATELNLDAPTIATEVLPVLLQRSIGVLKDALVDQESNDYHDEAVAMFRELLKRN